MKFWQSLKVKIVLSLMTVLTVAFGSVMLYTYTGTRKALTKREINNMRQELQGIANKVDAYLDKIELIPAFTFEDNVQAMLERPENETSIQGMLRLIRFREFYSKRLFSLNISRELQDIYFIYPDGEVLHKGSGIYDETYDFTQTAWYRSAVAARGRAILIDTHHQVYNMPNRFSDASGPVCLSVATAVVHRNADKLLGVLMMDIRLDEISDILEPLLLGYDSRVFFANDAGEIVYDTAGDGTLGQTLPASVREGLRGANGSFSTPLDQRNMTVTYLKSEKTGWWMVSLNQTDLLLWDIIQQERNILLVALAAFAVTILLGTVFSRRILRPLTEVTQALNRIKAGDLDVRLPVHSADEIGQVASSLNAMSSQLSTLISENYLIRLREKEAQIEMLQSQINPHFLYNTLESINCIAQVREITEISVISRALARMLRHSFREGCSFVSVREELDNVLNYMKIQTIRFSNRVRMETEIPPEVMELSILRMSLQPLAENVIQHELENSVRPIVMRVCVRREGECLAVSVWDNGPGISGARLAEIRSELSMPIRFDDVNAHQHLGLKNLNNRLRLHYGEGRGLTIDSVEGVETVVGFRVPVEGARQTVN